MNFPGFEPRETVSGDAKVLRRGDWDTWTDPDIQINDLVCLLGNLMANYRGLKDGTTSGAFGKQV